jgi:hypothetical protein
MDHRRREPDQAAKIAAIEDGRKVSGMVEEHVGAMVGRSEDPSIVVLLGKGRIYIMDLR